METMTREEIQLRRIPGPDKPCRVVLSVEPSHCALYLAASVLFTSAGSGNSRVAHSLAGRTTCKDKIESAS